MKSDFLGKSFKINGGRFPMELEKFTLDAEMKQIEELEEWGLRARYGMCDDLAMDCAAKYFCGSTVIISQAADGKNRLNEEKADFGLRITVESAENLVSDHKACYILGIDEVYSVGKNIAEIVGEEGDFVKVKVTIFHEQGIEAKFLGIGKQKKFIGHTELEFSLEMGKSGECTYDSFLIGGTAVYIPFKFK